MAAKPKPMDAPGEAVSFEAALKALETIVQRLEAGDVDLEESIRIYEEGVKLKAICEKKLAEAQERVDKIVIGQDGTVGTEPAGIA